MDVVMIVFSLFALVLNTSGINVVRLVRVFRVFCSCPTATRAAGRDGQTEGTRRDHAVIG